MIGLKQIETVPPHFVRQGINIRRLVDFKTDHGSFKRFACEMRHRTAPGCDGNQRRRLAFSPSLAAVVHNHMYQQCILTAISDVADRVIGQIMEINVFYFHREYPPLKGDGQAAVDDQCLTGYVCGIGSAEEPDDARDFFGSASPAKR